MRHLSASRGAPVRPRPQPPRNLATSVRVGDRVSNDLAFFLSVQDSRGLFNHANARDGAVSKMNISICVPCVTSDSRGRRINRLRCPNGVHAPPYCLVLFRAYDTSRLARQYNTQKPRGAPQGLSARAYVPSRSAHRVPCLNGVHVPPSLCPSLQAHMASRLARLYNTRNHGACSKRLSARGYCPSRWRTFCERASACGRNSCVWTEDSGAG